MFARVTLSSRIDQMIAEGLAEADDLAVPTSTVVRKALRVARLRNDWKNVLRLDIELRATGSAESRRLVHAEVAAHFTREELDVLWRQTTEDYIGSRTAITSRDQQGEPLILRGGIGELEAGVRELRIQADKMPAATGPNATVIHREAQRRADAIGELRLAVMEREQILSRVRQIAASYLSRAERELLLGQVNSDAFERNRVWVDGQLAARAPDVLSQFHAAYRRGGEGDAEARAHALTSCRRVLSSIADVLYPPTGNVVEGIDGRERKMGADAYLNRLLQYATDAQMGSRSREILIGQIKALGERLSAINGLASQGVHAEVTPAEVDQCVLQTYLAVGDLLRLRHDDSGAQQTDHEIEAAMTQN